MYHTITLLANNTLNNGQTNNYIITLISVSIPAFITILGFFITTKSVSRTFKNEIAKQKTNVHIEKMSTIPYDILMLMERILDGTITNSNLLKEFKVLMNSIYSYGSEKAIQLVSLMQKENYNQVFTRDEAGMYRLSAFYILLATQIKFDVTGILVSPNLWYQMKVTDYENNKTLLMTENNKIVHQLNLSKKMIIE